MALFDPGSTGTLEDALGQQANDASNTIEQQYAKKRRQSIAQAGASGRLNSGVYNYTAGDINAQEAGDLGGVESALASSLGQIPTQDYGQQQGNSAKRQLAELLAKLQKPSALEEAFGTVGTLGNIASTAAPFFL